MLRSFCAVALLVAAAPPADAADVDQLKGKFAFNWHAMPSRVKCAKVDGKLFAEIASKSFTCEMKPITNTASGKPARVCTSSKGDKEYLIFDTLKACEEERKTQASNE
jgi:hypothetical protein